MKKNCLLCDKKAKFQTWQYWCIQHKTHHIASWCSDKCREKVSGLWQGKHHNHHKQNKCAGEFSFTECDKQGGMEK